MATAKERLNEIVESLNEVELAEIIDFAEFINNKRQKLFDEAFKNVSEIDESLTEEELKSLKEAKESGSISYKEMWNSCDEV